MRIKNLLGLFAIGGAIAYANKKRGGDFTFGSFKETIDNLTSGLKDKLNSFTGAAQDKLDADSDVEKDFDGQAYSSGFGGVDSTRNARH